MLRSQDFEKCNFLPLRVMIAKFGQNDHKQTPITFILIRKLLMISQSKNYMTLTKHIQVLITRIMVTIFREKFRQIYQPSKIT